MEQLECGGFEALMQRTAGDNAPGQAFREAVLPVLPSCPPTQLRVATRTKCLDATGRQACHTGRYRLRHARVGEMRQTDGKLTCRSLLPEN